MKRTVLFLILLAISAAFVNAAGSVNSGSAVIKISLLNQDPNPARAGDTVNLRLKVENEGGQPVKVLEMQILEDYPFTVASGDDVKSIQNLNAYTTGDNYVNVEYKVKIDKDATQGTKPLQVRYRMDNSPWTTMALSVSVSTQEFAQIIFVDKAKLAPGKETDLKFTINNVGNAPLQNMIFSWNEENGVILPVFSGDSKYIKYLDAGDSVDLTYKVIADVNANPGLYQLDLNLQYESVTDVASSVMTTKAGIFVGGATDFDVTFSESTQGQTSLSIANTGNNPAQSVSVKIPQQENFMVTGTNSAIVGNLDKGDYTIVSFQIAQASNLSARRQQAQNTQQDSKRNASITGNLNSLKVNIEYTDTTGERITVEKIVPIQFRSAGSQTNDALPSRRSSQYSYFSSFWLYAIISASLIIGFLILRNNGLRNKILGQFGKGK